MYTSNYQAQPRSSSAHFKKDLGRLIIEQSTTPFEKLSSEYESNEIDNSFYFDHYVSYWQKVLSSANEPVKLSRFVEFSNLTQQDVHRLIAPAKLKREAVLPEWVNIFNNVIDQETRRGEILKLKTGIPFEEVLTNFVSSYNYFLKKGTKENYNLLLPQAHQELKRALLQSLSSIASQVLLDEFESFRASYKDISVNDRDIYQAFVNSLQEDSLISFLFRYPVLARILSNTTWLFTNFVSRFVERFMNDEKEIFTKLLSEKKTGNKIVHLSVGISDLHNGGESVIIVGFSAGRRVVYKPRCLKISQAYNHLLSWVNDRTNLDLKQIRVIAKKSYGWMEFISESPNNTNKEIAKYYQRAGALLGVSYLLGSTDLHAENVIANGSQPLMIDHETLLQPEFKYDFKNLNEKEREEKKKLNQSVLRTHLLPMYSSSTSLASDTLSGFGSVELKDVIWNEVNQIIDANTNAMRIGRVKLKKEYTANLPKINSQIARIADYKEDFIAGFELMYSVFQREQTNLLSNNSILSVFENLNIRFLFRSTQVYSSILNSNLKSDYLRDANLYGFRLELLARAFLTTAEKPIFWRINAAERKEMLQRDIPCFSVKTDDSVLKINEKEKVEAYFETDCLSSIRERISQLTEKDLLYQKRVIARSIAGEFNSFDW